MPTTVDESIKQQLLARVRPDVPYRDYFANAIDSAFGLAARLEDERERINADGRFSDHGKRASLSALVADHFAPELAQGAGKVARHAGQRNESRRTAIGRPKFDSTDLVAAMERREVRDYLRAQPEGKRLQVAFEVVKDRKMAEAVLSGPGMALTGLRPEQFTQVHRLYLQTFFGDELADVEAERNDIEAVAAAATIVRRKLMEASGLSPTEFDDLMKPIEAKVDGK